ncbi:MULTISPECIES: imidazole glycerol phosphate synthase subunit HisH [Faecalicoccus]|uniref:Imidazole glycerol phosphate synthase subunit HisH n=1 Tax=Faecalicoccus pleomorphus TaxID=1323 RepID=A0AAW6CQ64_9FIRM|nr:MULTISPECIES: imidazole glycerol phosphate synthase subunit HisH [Faecalicoccus]MDB7980199.1 imidazole glycerol phosphate synthase subunit HisH [Faecalicoccus pleomorphus]MDB7982533.1 imidazole glycerol phosphate synthase subunit HisH [Faecalicoccus pleomorphus]
MIGIIDYGMGNLFSVHNAVQKLDYDVLISSDPVKLEQCQKLILPGVGAFGDMMKNIKESQLDAFIENWVRKEKKPLLGICLGMQSFFESSEENGIHEGFGFLKGQIVFMKDQKVRVPHIGWNDLIKENEHPIFSKLSAHPYVYYVHSYYASNMDPDDLIGYCNYGTMKIPGLIMHENVMGCQFHPEKSGEDGLKILQYYLEEFV